MTEFPNIGWLFYKDYYKGIDWEVSEEDKVTEEGKARLAANKSKLEAANEGIFKLRLDDGLPHMKFDGGPLPDLEKIDLTTVYPGLLVGSGYNHGTNKEGEIKIGFFFDHTTGLPFIPGSSVKGVLRSAFPGQYHAKAGKIEGQMESLKRKVEKLNGENNPSAKVVRMQKKLEQLQKEADHFSLLGEKRLAFIQYLLTNPDEVGAIGEAQATKEAISELESTVFEGMLPEKSRDETKTHYTIYERDVFHDAVLLKSEHQARVDKGYPQGCFLGEDFLTPHKNPNKDKDHIPDALKNPVPISFMKVLPSVTFRFWFSLPSRKGEFLEPGQRLLLFEKILRYMGAGAKTNLGYGHWAES